MKTSRMLDIGHDNLPRVERSVMASPLVPFAMVVVTHDVDVVLGDGYIIYTFSS